MLVEPEAALGVLEGRLDRPAESGDPDQPGQAAGRVFGQVGQVVGALVLAAVPADQQSPLTAGPCGVRG